LRITWYLDFVLSSPVITLLPKTVASFFPLVDVTLKV